MTDLLLLAERVEGAMGPDRELDELIAAAIQSAVREVQPDGRTAYHSLDGRSWVSVAVGAYTTSLDAALTLVPEGWAVERWQIWPGQRSTLSLYETRQAPTGERYRSGGEAIAHASGETPALALCAAALRARSTMEGLS